MEAKNRSHNTKKIKRDEKKRRCEEKGVRNVPKILSSSTEGTRLLVDSEVGKREGAITRVQCPIITCHRTMYHQKELLRYRSILPGTR